MLQTRAGLQRALNELVDAGSADQRRAAGEQLIEAIHAYLASDEVVDSMPAMEGIQKAATRWLGEAKAPVSELSEEALKEFNLLLPWAAMTVDQTGRLVGRAWSSEKRYAVHGLVESRQLTFNREYPLTGKHVMEMGCFEGIHTVGLTLLGARVTAVDGRIENILKTLARVWAYGRSCEAVLWNFERERPSNAPAECDVLHHIGVLYHLSNPVEHLEEVLPMTGQAVLLDTHVATSEAEAVAEYTVNGRTYRYRPKGEPHASNAPFAGMEAEAKYLLVEDLADLVRRHGFTDTRVVADRVERNGRRITIWGFR